MKKKREGTRAEYRDKYRFSIRKFKTLSDAE